MGAQSVGTWLRRAVMLAVGLLTLWLVPLGGQGTFAGVVLALVAGCGLLVREGRVAWYVLGVVLVIAGLALGIKDGPFDVATTGYCDSAFDPGYVVQEDAPPGTYERCDEVRRERIPIIALLGSLGLGALAASFTPRRVSAEADETAASGAR